MKKLSAAFFALLILSLAVNCYPQEEVTTVSGSLIALDLTGMTLSLEYLDENTNPATITVNISQDIELFDVESLEALQIGDEVTIDYIVDEESNLMAMYLYKFIPQE